MNIEMKTPIKVSEKMKKFSVKLCISDFALNRKYIFKRASGENNPCDGEK